MYPWAALTCITTDDRISVAIDRTFVPISMPWKPYLREPNTMTTTDARENLPRTTGIRQRLWLLYAKLAGRAASDDHAQLPFAHSHCRPLHRPTFRPKQRMADTPQNSGDRTYRYNDDVTDNRTLGAEPVPELFPYCAKGYHCRAPWQSTKFASLVGMRLVKGRAAGLTASISTDTPAARGASLAA